VPIHKESDKEEHGAHKKDDDDSTNYEYDYEYDDSSDEDKRRVI